MTTSALHRIRLSQVPLSSSEPTVIGSFAQLSDGYDSKVAKADEEYEPDPAILKESLRQSVRYNIVASHHYKKFLLKLAHALMEFGAPMHKIDEQLSAAAQFFGLHAQFILMNTVIIAVFQGSNGSPSQTHFIQGNQGLSLAQLRKTHTIYYAVVHDEISALEGTYQLTHITDSFVSLSTFWKIVLAFLAAAAICPIGFSGSVADSLVAGTLSAILQWIQVLGDQDVLFVGIFECVHTLGFLISH
jgi:uncharacterized membrane protein YjjP (DUF1212 family)